MQPVGPSVATGRSHTCFVTPGRGLTQARQWPWHAQSCCLAGPRHHHPNARRGGTVGTEVAAGPGPAGLIPDWTSNMGTRQRRGCGAQAAREAPSQPLPAADRQKVTHLPGDPALHPSTVRGPALRSAEPMFMGAQEERTVPRSKHGAETCHLLPPRSQGNGKEVPSLSWGHISQGKGQGQRRGPGPPPGVWGSNHEGGTMGEDRGQALHSHPCHRTGDTMGPPLRGPLDIALSPTQPPAHHHHHTRGSSGLRPGDTRTSREGGGGPGTPAGRASAWGCLQAPRAVRGACNPPLCSQPFLGSPVWGGPWPVPAPQGWLGKLGQDVPLARKPSKPAAPSVCSPAKQRVPFPVPLSPALG